LVNEANKARSIAEAVAATADDSSLASHS
jgi:hypothetical protein